MSEKRKDSKGRILRTGESQRKDGLYQYRYTDHLKIRRTIYSNNLKTLRKKEDEINESLKLGIDITGGEKTVLELCENYLNRAARVCRYNTHRTHQAMYNIIKRYPIAQEKIRDISMSEAKDFLILLNDNGLMYGSVARVHSILNRAFRDACEDNMIIKNPFAFHVSDVIKNDKKEKIALTKEQVDNLLEFIHSDQICKKYYDKFIILLGTGLRASELLGLTMKDLDFKNRIINVDHQGLLKHDGSRERYILPPKTKSGIRKIPMSDAVFSSFQRLIEYRISPPVEPVIDNYTGFIFLNKKGQPKFGHSLYTEVRFVSDKYNQAHPDNPMPSISPHILRHTFCTNLVNSGMDITSVQYLMGHSKADITLGTYTHASYDHTMSEVRRLTGKLEIELPVT